tara:strand:+ start:9559 stop:10608 length:1050 start_codon:yes stop_codon:yes gene_type:complete
MRYYEFIVEYKTEITKNKFGDKILDKLQIQNIIDLKPDIEAGRPMSKPTDYQQLALHIMGVRGLDFNGPGSPWESVDQELFDKHKNEIVEKLIAQFEDFDPTANKQYMPYLLNWYVNSGEIGSYAFPNLEDARSTLKESLIMFYKLRERIPEKYRDISQYESASDFMHSTYALQSQYGKQEKLDKGESEIIYNSKYATIYWPKDEEGSCYLGQGTQWCTASTRSANYFDQYNKDGPLIIINMKEKIRVNNGWVIDDDGGETEDPYGEKYVNKIQAHMEVDPDDNGKLLWTWGHIADTQDEEVDYTTLYDNNPNFKAMDDSPEFQQAMDDVSEKWWDYNGLALLNSPNGD